MEPIDKQDINTARENFLNRQAKYLEYVEDFVEKFGQYPGDPSYYSTDDSYTRHPLTITWHTEFFHHSIILDEIGRPIIPFRETNYPYIFALDRTFLNHRVDFVIRLCKYFFPEIPQFPAALHFLPINTSEAEPETLVGICQEGKLLSQNIIPVGEKVSFSDLATIDIFDQEFFYTYLQKYSIRERIWFTLRRALMEELGFEDIEALFKRSSNLVKDYPFIDLTYGGFVNFPYVLIANKDLRPLFETYTQHPDQREWNGSLFWIPLRLLQEESYDNSPIPHGIRFAAEQILANLPMTFDNF